MLAFVVVWTLVINLGLVVVVIVGFVVALVLVVVVVLEQVEEELLKLLGSCDFEGAMVKPAAKSIKNKNLKNQEIKKLSKK